MHAAEYMRKVSAGENDVWDCISSFNYISSLQQRSRKVLVAILSVVRMSGSVDHQVTYFQVRGTWYRYDDVTNTRKTVSQLPLNNGRETVSMFIYA
jgi:hypothetical protein